MGPPQGRPAAPRPPPAPYWIWESRPCVMTPVNLVVRRVSTSSQCARLSSSAHHAPSKKSSSLGPAWGQRGDMGGVRGGQGWDRMGMGWGGDGDSNAAMVGGGWG